MKILYGVVGEGMGHATRSKVVIEHLVETGHRVKIVASGRAFHFLKKSFDDVVEIQGLTMQYRDGAFDRDLSVLRNVLLSPKIILDNAHAYFEEVRGFQPEMVVSDFDSFAHLFAKRHGLPIVSIDNQQIIHRCKHDKDIKEGVALDFEGTKAFVKAKLPGCDQYIITSFFFPKVRDKFAHNTTLVPPILRKPILEVKPTRGDHVLVYQTSASDQQLLPTLKKLSKRSFVVYGLRREAVEDNCIIKDFSEEGFVKDLASSRAVVTNGGLSLLHEAIYLGKPIFSVPVRHQFEQEMNARYLEKLGYGLGAPFIQADTLEWFLQQESRYVSALAHHKQHGNDELFRALDLQIERFARRNPGKKKKKIKAEPSPP
ncbi:MAG: teichoic acid biosynthesis protein [Deltaproteobacteria bacterium]|nr:teichoic acid biosynthesis protein [Deltaproteobacteria bacterium]